MFDSFVAITESRFYRATKDSRIKIDIKRVHLDSQGYTCDHARTKFTTQRIPKYFGTGENLYCIEAQHPNSGCDLDGVWADFFVRAIDKKVARAKVVELWPMAKVSR